MNTGTKAFRCEGKGIESVRSDSHTRMLAIDVMVEGGGQNSTARYTTSTMLIQG